MIYTETPQFVPFIPQPKHRHKFGRWHYMKRVSDILISKLCKKCGARKIELKKNIKHMREVV